MNIEIRDFLIELSRDKRNPTITYQKLSDSCNLKLNMQGNPNDRLKIGALLGEISEFEHINNRPLISALVIRVTDGEEGDGFYKLAEKLGFGKFKKLKEDLFEYEQVKNCVDFWTNEINYKLYKNII